jgi:HTH-type transcriptional regulator/antitoxin HigA
MKNKTENRIRPIRTRTNYRSSLERIEVLIRSNPKKGSNEFDELDVLGTLVSAYEDVNFPIDAPDPVDAVKYVMEEEGLKPKDLVPYFGSKGNVSEFFSHKRKLSLRVIKILHEKFKLPYEVLVA